MKTNLEKTIVEKLIEQQNQISEYERGLGDILICLNEKIKGNNHLSIQNRNPLVGSIICKIKDGLKEK